MTHREEFRAYMKAANRTSGSNDDSHLSEAQVIAYCRDEMSAAEHEAAQTHLVNCEQCVTLFRNARDFLDPPRDDEEQVTATETNDAWRSFSQRMQIQASTSMEAAEGAIVSVDFQRRRYQKNLSRLSLALAASLLITLGALGLQTWRLWREQQSRQQSQETVMQIERKQRELEQRLAQLEQSGGDQLKQEREQRLAAEAERDKLQARLDAIQPGSPENIPVYTARLSSERGAEDEVRVRFIGGTKVARLKLLISKPYEFPEYTIQLLDSSGRIVREISELRPSRSDGALSFLVNRSTLSTGKYKLRMFGGKAKNQLGEYSVSVTVTGP